MSVVGLEFEWDENKNLLNIKNHKVRFQLAAQVFRDPYRIELYDDEHSTEEDQIGLESNKGMYYNDNNPDMIRSNSISSSYRRDIERMVIIKQSDLPPITEAELAELEEAARHPITFDEDCPELTPEMLARFRRVNGDSTGPIRA